MSERLEKGFQVLRAEVDYKMKSIFQAAYIVANVPSPACSNRRMVIEDGLEEDEMNIHIVDLTELIANHLVENIA